MRRADAAIAVALLEIAGAVACVGAQGAGAGGAGASAQGAGAGASAQGASAGATAQGASATAPGATAQSASTTSPDDADIVALPYRLRIDDIHVDEPLAPLPDLVESVTAGVHRLRTRYTMCLELAIRKADGGVLAPGSAVVVYAIAPSGDIESASVDRPTTPPLLATCLARAGQTTQFTPNARRARVSVRFALSHD